MLDHQVKQAERPFSVEKEVLIHHKEGPDLHIPFHQLHDFKQLVARFVEVDVSSLAAEHGRRGAKVARHGAPDGGDECGRYVARLDAERYTESSRGDAGDHIGVDDGPGIVLGEKPSHPPNALAPDDVVGVDPAVEVRQTGHVPADDDCGVGQVLSDQLAHPPNLADVDDNGSDSDDVVGVRGDLLDEALLIGEIEECARGGDVGLNHHNAPRAMEHSQ